MARWSWLVGLVACGGGGDGRETTPGGSPRACDDSELDGDCIDFTGEGWEAGEVACDSQTLVATCPTGALGLCTLEGGTEFETVTHFYPGFWTDQQASAACSGQGGSWQLL